MQTGSKELIRDINFHLILEAIINEGPISRAGLAKHLGLTKATVSSIVFFRTSRRNEKKPSSKAWTEYCFSRQPVPRRSADITVIPVVSMLTASAYPAS